MLEVHYQILVLVHLPRVLLLAQPQVLLEQVLGVLLQVKVLSTVVQLEHLLQGLFLPLRFSRFNLRYFFFTTCKCGNT